MTKKDRTGENCVSEVVRIAVQLALEKFQQSEDQKELEFPSSLTAKERAFIHDYCQTLGLKSKSRGKRSSRYLTVYKKEGSTIVQADAVFSLCRASQQHTVSLLQRYPVNARERQELLPPTDRDRLMGQECRDVNRTTGRLNNGIPQIPPWRVESEFQGVRQKLPIGCFKEQILQALALHQVLLLTGETGCGKTTQVPQFILEHCHLNSQPCRIICTQPRRLAALTVAERVAAERDEKVGQTVGYQIRLESRVSPKTLLTFCTNGVLLRSLMGGDAALATVTHIIVDELHERDRLSDFLLVVLRDLLLKFRNLKLILMSATIDIQLFAKYFGGCPVIEVPGKNHKVETFYLEDILKLTGYMTPAMSKYKRDLSQSQHCRERLATWCDQPTCSSSSGDELPSPDSNSPRCTLARTHRSSSFELSDLEQVITEKTELDPELAKEVDVALQEAWLRGSDEAFQRLLNLLLTERVSVDYQHSETTASPLMVAAGRGKPEVVEYLLSLSASTTLQSSNGWTALAWANAFAKKDVAELLASACNVEEEERPEGGSSVTCSEEDRQLLDMYHHSFNDDHVDLNLILALLHKIHTTSPEGAVLVFLPGYDDIVTLREKILSDEKYFLDNNRYILYTLHSNMQCSDQKRMFSTPPNGVRKIILSTNIAETSITINDIVYVIDSGKVKEKSFDALTGVTSLKSMWISQASAQQRKGRSGRCHPGVCYHLFSRHRMSTMQKYQQPEILRLPIHELCLQAKLLAPPNIPIADFLARAPSSPPFMVTRNAVTLLKTIDALDPWEELTELGLHILDLPIEPHLAKMVLYSVVLKCLDPILTIVSCLAYRDPFVLPSQPSQKQVSRISRKKFASETFSDHMVLLRAFQAWQKARSDGYESSFCEKNFISSATMEIVVGMRTQLLGQLRASGFVRARGGGDIRDLNSNSENWAVIKAALVAGSYPNLIRVDRERQQLITQKESKVRFHVSSVLNFVPTVSAQQSLTEAHSHLVSRLPCDWLFYEEMTRCGRFAHARCCTLVAPITVALFAGPARLPLDSLHEPDFDHMEGYAEESDSETEDKNIVQKSMLKLDEWISFKIEPDIARLAVQLRQKWHALLLRRMQAPAKPWSQVDEAVIRAVVSVLSTEEQAAGLQQPSGIGQRPRPMTEFCPTVSVGPQFSSGTLSPPGSSSSSSSSQVYSRMAQDLKYVVADIADESKGPHESPRRGKLEKVPSRSSDERSDTSSVHSGSCSDPLSPCGSPSPSSSGLRGGPTPNSSGFHRRYIVVKASSPKSIDVSVATGLWAFTQSMERKLQWILAEGKDVFLVFSVQGSGHFQGFARLTAETSQECPPEFAAPNLGTCYVIEWQKRGNLPFQSTQHLQNPWNENRKVQISRDGQELEPSIGEALCALWDHPFHQPNQSHAQLNTNSDYASHLKGRFYPWAGSL